MRHKYRSLAILVGLLALLPSVSFGRLYVGDNAPNFTLPDTAYINHQQPLGSLNRQINTDSGGHWLFDQIGFA